MTPTVSLFIGQSLFESESDFQTKYAETDFNNLVVSIGIHGSPANQAGVIHWGTGSSPKRYLVQNGTYVGDKTLAEAINQLGATSHLQFMIGGADNGDPSNIRKLMFPKGPTSASSDASKNGAQIGPGTVLYENFNALKKTFTNLKGICFDDEELYDPQTTVGFATLLQNLGMTMTCCPFNDPSFWVNCVQQAPEGAISRFYLQCYGGGPDNDPKDWMSPLEGTLGAAAAKAFVYPGLSCGDCTHGADGMTPEDFKSKLSGWVPEGIQGAFLWEYSDLKKCQNYTMKDYSQAMEQALTSSS